MASIDFPAYLPVIKKSGYAISQDLGIKRTQMASGASRQRRVTPKRTIIKANLSLTQAQFRVFETFAMIDGHDWFNAKILTGDGVQITEARMIANYNHQVDGNLHQVSFDLELKNHPNEIYQQHLVTPISEEQRESFYTFGAGE